MRYATSTLILASVLLAGCGGTAEIKPQADSKGPVHIDVEATQKAMDESMQHMQGKMDPRMMEYMNERKAQQQKMVEEMKAKGS